MKSRLLTMTLMAFTTLSALVLLVCLMDRAGLRIAAQALAAPSEEPGPAVTGIFPSVAPNDLNTPVVIAGGGFAAALSSTLAITPPRAYLGKVALDEVTWVNSSTLRAVVPWGLDAGTWPLTVINPDGLSGTLASAFTVTQGIGMWTTGGPYGGRVVDLALHPLTPTTVYAAAFSTGLFASYDSGEHWQPILANYWPLRLVFDAQDPNVMYYGADSADFFKTTDSGRTWERLPSLFHSHNGCYSTYPFAHPVSAGVVYAGTGSCGGIPVLPGEGGVFFSADYGETWVTRTHGLTDTDVIDIAFFPDDPDQMLVVTKSGNLFQSTDGGEDWNWIAQVSDEIRRVYFNPYGAHEAWIVPATPYQPPSTSRLYSSTDLTTWISHAITSDLSSSGGIWSLTFTPGTIWAAGDRGYTSSDGGSTWAPVIGPESPFDVGVRAFVLDPGNPNRIYAADSTRGVLRSTDGGTSWHETNDGLAAIEPRGLAVASGDPDTVYVDTFEYGLLKSSNGGGAWQALDIHKGGPPKGAVVAGDPYTTTRVYYAAGCSDAATTCVWISENAGLSWREVKVTLPITYHGWNGEFLSVAPHPLLPGRILASAGFYLNREEFDSGIEPSGIYTSDDYGEHWAFLDPSPAVSEVLGFAFDATDPDLIYATTAGSGLLRSSDGGANWQSVDPPGVLPPVSIADIAAHPSRSGNVYIRLYSSAAGPNPEPLLFRSQDSGETWTPALDARSPVRLLFSPPLAGRPPYTLFTGCGDGVCKRLEGEADWQTIAGVPRPTLLAAGTDGERAVVYVGSPGGIASSVNQAAVKSLGIMPGQGSLLGGGVYRLTTRLPDHFVYLPMTVKDIIPLASRRVH